MGKTKIEWTDVAWQITNGCRRVSPGCERCYAERLIATRLSKTDKYKGLAIYGEHGARWTGQSRFWAKGLAMPLRLREPSRIFVADMGDLFYEKVTNEEIAAVFGVMAAAPRHTFQVLTKRHKRLREWFAWAAMHGNWIAAMGDHAERHGAPIYVTKRGRSPWNDYGCEWPLPNVWLGVSAEDQQRADERIPGLLATPAAVRFVSYEPALGPVDFAMASTSPDGCSRWPWLPIGVQLRTLAADSPTLDWIIVGGESGYRARPFDIQWARDVVAQCKAAGVACFVKQLGAEPHDSMLSMVCGSGPDDPESDTRLRLKAPKGNVDTEWAEDLRVREYPA